MMASSRWTSFSFLFLAVIHVSSAFCPSSLRSTTFTRSVFSSNSNSNPNSNGIGVLVLSSTENDDVDVSPTYYSPNVPLADSTDDDDDQYFLSSVSPSPDVTTAAGSTNEYSFFDEAIIRVRGGSGGQGSSTFKLMPGGQDGPPDGGNGGGGGNVVLEMDPTLNSLAGLTQAWRPNAFGGSGAASQTQLPSPKSFRAENGGDGDRQFKNGRFGKYVSIRVPPGTVVQHQWTVTEGDNVTVHLVDLGSLTLEENSLIVAMGGDGGEGSCVTGKKGGSRRARCPPTGGERKTLKLTLKMVADVALVGVPNTGKSTFLASVTRAKPKIANYPFTTVIPNLGVWIPADTGYSSNQEQSKGAGSDGLVLCDVPGLIEGAANGVGLGHAFLRHVERCHVILHLIDATSNDPVADFEMLNREILKYGTGQLGQMPQVVVVNKVDAFTGRASEDWEEGLQVKLQRAELEERLKAVMPHTRLMWMSAKEREGVDDLMLRMATFVKKVKQAIPE